MGRISGGPNYFKEMTPHRGDFQLVRVYWESWWYRAPALSLVLPVHGEKLHNGTDGSMPTIPRVLTNS